MEGLGLGLPFDYSAWDVKCSWSLLDRLLCWTPSLRRVQLIHSLSNWLFPLQAKTLVEWVDPDAEKQIPVWWIVVAVLAGLLLFAVLIIIFWKVSKI